MQNSVFSVKVPKIPPNTSNPNIDFLLYLAYLGFISIPEILTWLQTANLQQLKVSFAFDYFDFLINQIKSLESNLMRCLQNIYFAQLML